MYNFWKENKDVSTLLYSLSLSFSLSFSLSLSFSVWCVFPMQTPYDGALKLLRLFLAKRLFFHLIAMCETKLGPIVEDSIVSLERYTIIRPHKTAKPLVEAWLFLFITPFPSLVFVFQLENGSLGLTCLNISFVKSPLAVFCRSLWVLSTACTIYERYGFNTWSSWQHVQLQL